VTGPATEGHGPVAGDDHRPVSDADHDGPVAGDDHRPVSDADAHRPVVGGDHRPTVDYDHHRPTTEWDPHTVHAELRRRCPVAFTTHHGGYWVITAHGVVSGCARDAATFSSEHDLDGSGSGTEFQGIGLPAEPSHRSIPSEVDPPQLSDYRRLLQPWFTPTASVEWRRRVERWAHDCIAPHLGEGRIDLVLDLANPVPAMFTLALVGLPVDEWERFAGPLHDLVHAAPGSPEKLHARAEVAELREALRRLVGARRRHRVEDLASAVAHAEIGGTPVSEEQAVSTLFAVVSGGVDTTTALLANAFSWLDEHRDVRTRLIEQPSLRRAAGDELKLLTKEYFGYYDDLPKRDRERAQGLYRAWWDREGRRRFT